MYRRAIYRNCTKESQMTKSNMTSKILVGLLVTPTDRPKSVRNRCVIEVFGGVSLCCPLVFEFSVGIGGFVIGLGQISFFFSLNNLTSKWNISFCWF